MRFFGRFGNYGNGDGDGGDDPSSLIEPKVRSVIKVERNLADVRDG